MLYISAILYLACIYIRPAEIFIGWRNVAVLDLLTLVSIFLGAWQWLVEPRRFWNVPQDKCMLGLWASAVISNLVWGWFGGALLALTRLSGVVFCYFLLRLAITTPGRLRGMVATVICLTLFQAINGVAQYHTGVGVGNVTVFASTFNTVEGAEAVDDAVLIPRIRGTGIFNDPNDLALTLVICVPFVLGLVGSRSSSLVGRFVGIAVLVPMLLAIYYTNSRGGVIALGGVIVSQAFRSRGKAVGLAVATLGLVALIAAGPSRIARIDSSEASAQGRIQAWSAGLQMFKAQPVFGVGFGRYTDFHDRVAHNSFVHTLAELGFVGAFCLVGAFYWFFQSISSVHFDNRDITLSSKRLRGEFVVSGVALIAAASFLSRQYNLVPYILLSLGASYVATVQSEDRVAELRWRFVDVTNIALLTAAGITVTYLVVRTYAIWSR